jgi:hypothetical protein
MTYSQYLQQFVGKKGDFSGFHNDGLNIFTIRETGDFTIQSVGGRFYYRYL